jgi:hypothetical protein
MTKLPRLIRFTVASFLPLIVLAAAAGCSGPTPYGGLHPSSQVGREVSIHGTFNGPGVQGEKMYRVCFIRPRKERGFC